MSKPEIAITDEQMRTLTEAVERNQNLKACPIEGCGGTMVKWNGSRVYRDAEDKVEWRCILCGNKEPMKGGAK